jgi:hypothetical protein
LNYQLYALALGPNYGRAYHDVTVGDNTYHGANITIQGYSAARGWDPASGLGTPQANVLIPELAGRWFGQ